MSCISNNFDVAIAGGGPAGTSAAIELAMKGARVLLAEQKKFPRAKLCGEFISPECLSHFQRLGVADRMISSGAMPLSQTVFYSRKGRSVVVPSEWFSSGTNAIGLSRSQMDHNLLERAKSVGVVVLEDAHASSLLMDRGHVCGMTVKTGEQVTEYEALVTIDATGRTRALARRLNRPAATTSRRKPRLVAFKAHLENAHVAKGACEIYFYRGGYGGLSGVEGGLSNLCFIVSAEDVRHCGSNPEIVMRDIVMKNARAAYALAESRARTEWLSVSLGGFGQNNLAPASGMLTIGDAAAFIDPFTGSGMLMALECGLLAGETIVRHLARLRDSGPFDLLESEYKKTYLRKFGSRLRTASLLRRAAFVSPLAEAAIIFFSGSTNLHRKLARATRPANFEIGSSAL